LKREDSCVGSSAFWLLASPASSVGLLYILRLLLVSFCTVHKEAALAPVPQIFLGPNLEKKSTAAIHGRRQFKKNPRRVGTERSAKSAAQPV